MDPGPAPCVTLLDGFALHPGGRQPGPAGDLPRGVQRLIAHLCLSGRPARTVVAGQLWPDVPDGHAHGSLRSALWRLPQVAPRPVEVHGDSRAPADGVRRSCPSRGPEGHGVRTARA